MPTTKKALVSAHRLTHLAEELSKSTGDQAAVQRALDAAELSASDLGQESHYITAESEARFLQEAVTILRDKSFAAVAGLHFGRNSGFPRYVAKYSKNLYEAFRNAGKYTVLTDRIFSYQLRTPGDSVSIVLISSCPHLEFGDRVREFLIFAILAVMRNTTGCDLRPLEIRFSHDESDARRSLAQIAGCNVTFGAEWTEIVINPATLDLPVPTYDPSLLRYLEDYGDSLVAQLDQPEPSLRTRIEALLIDQLPERILQAPEVAAELGISHRTFTRRLAEDGQTFSSILDDLRGTLAKTYLAQSNTPIAEIAYLLDYADQAAFTTAFKRWAGVTPKSFRDSAS